MKKKERFITVYTEGNSLSIERKILVDRETGVNYFWAARGYGAGLTPLLDAEGKPVITPVYEITEE